MVPFYASGRSGRSPAAGAVGDAPALVQFPQVFLGQIHQQWKYPAGRGRSGVEVFVLDGRVDARVGRGPRVDPETGLGLVTDVCLKRKIRNYVETVKGILALSGFKDTVKTSFGISGWGFFR